MKKYYSFFRALHLYIGLFISPFVLVFAISVLVFDHFPSVNKMHPVKDLPAKNVRLDSIPVRGNDILTARAILDQIQLKGEIEYLNKNDSSMTFPVRSPETQNRVTVNTKTGMVSVIPSQQGALRATTFMHSMPGPHNVAIRGNSGFIKWWRYLADIIVYSVLFLTLSGIFLWYFLQSERKLGLITSVIGILTFITLLILIL